MGKKINRAAAVAVTAVAGAVTAVGAAGAASADTGHVQTRLADVSQVSLADLAVTGDSVLANSIRQVTADVSTDAGPLAGFQSEAPPR